MPKKLVIVCLLNFLVAALMGLALRYTFIDAIGFNYRFLTHAHSHVAMLGWVYLKLYTLIVHYFMPDKKPIYNKLFWITQASVIGMMLSFPFQGYAAISITFSTLHIFCSYYFVRLAWKNHKTDSVVSQYTLKAALIFMVVSTIGVWCLGPAVGLLGQASAFYQIAIQFFLHFQFNGWFLIAVLAVFFHLLKIKDSLVFQKFFKTLIAGNILTFALPVQWYAPHKALLYINAIGIILQVASLFYFLKLIQQNVKQFLNRQSKLIIILYYFSLFCFSLKIILQTFSIIPEFSQVVVNNRNFVIGFIHLMMLGLISGFLFSFILKPKKTKQSKELSIGVYSFLIGFVLTELILLVQGCYFYFGIGFIPNYYTLLFFFSTLLPLGLLFILIHFIKTKNHEKQASKTP